MKPFLKWVGGKGQLMDIINQNVPEDAPDIYIEPFLGGGSVFINMVQKNLFKKFIISDINSKLISVYECVRDNPIELMSELTNYKNVYNSLDNMISKRNYYYHQRELLNIADNSKLIDAALFIFLNKTCFNGLYRENSIGDFNTPFGEQENPEFFIEDNIMEWSNVLNMKDNDGNHIIIIKNCGFEQLSDDIDNNCFVYLDPPYRPITNGGFNSYNKSGFGDDMQIKLSEFYRYMDNKGAKLLLSNSNPKLLNPQDTFFDTLYNGFNIQLVAANRSVNSDPTNRGKITELLISNYTI